MSGMEQAALHRMAKSIAHYAKLQVKKLRLPPNSWKKRAISSVSDLDNATRQLHQLSSILDSCTISASYEVSEAQKALLLLPAPKKDLARLRKWHGIYLRPDYIYRNPPFLTWARPIFEQGALSPMSVFPADFPILRLLGDNSFRARMLKKHIAFPQ